MARPANPHTLQIRQLVGSFLENTPLIWWSVQDVREYLGSRLDSFTRIDIGKALSNELIRRETMGLLKSETGKANGVGRPCRIYTQVWKASKE